VASRHEEKQRRRAEREARERAEAAAAARRKRLQYVFGGLLAVLAVAAVAVLAVTSLGGGDDETEVRAANRADGVSVPAPRLSGNLTAAAKAAGCVVRNVPEEGRDHRTKDFKASDYGTNPPTSGPHNPNWYQDGVYVPGTTPRLGMLVHTLEHGRIDLQYRPGTSKQTVRRLEALVAQMDGGYHMLLFQNTTKMPYAVAATAWTHLLGCRSMNDRVFDAVRAFRTSYIDKGPEKIP
jgi:Protein of unknown function (DUF3105)